MKEILLVSELFLCYNERYPFNYKKNKLFILFNKFILISITFWQILNELAVANIVDVDGGMVLAARVCGFPCCNAPVDELLDAVDDEDEHVGDIEYSLLTPLLRS